MSSPWKTYRVSFCVRDDYTADIKARSEAEAIAKAQDLYAREHEDAFEFDISRGGTDAWEALSLPNDPTNESTPHARH
jgi:hypothetical protein